MPSEPEAAQSLPPAQLAEVQKYKANAKEYEKAEDAADDSPLRGSDIPGVSVIYSLSTLTPFHTLFCAQADKRHNLKAPEARVARHIEVRPKFYKWCCNLDLCFRVAVLGVLFLALAIILMATVYKTFLADIVENATELQGAADVLKGFRPLLG